MISHSFTKYGFRFFSVYTKLPLEAIFLVYGCLVSYVLSFEFSVGLFRPVRFRRRFRLIQKFFDRRLMLRNYPGFENLVDAPADLADEVGVKIRFSELCL